MPSPADTETTTRLKTVEAQGEDHETRLRAQEVQSTEQRTTRTLVAGLAARDFGAASTGAAIDSRREVSIVWERYPRR